MGAESVQIPDIMQHPTVGLYAMNEPEFFKRTKRIDFQGNVVSMLSGVPGQRYQDKIANRGIVSEIRYHIALSADVEVEDTVTLLDKWIAGFVSNLRVRANNTDLVQASGVHLEDLRFIDSSNADFSAIEATTIVPAGDADTLGARAIYMVLCVPLAINRPTIGGAVFAESNDTYLEWQIEFETAAELYTLADSTTIAWSGTITPVVTTWTIPYVNTSKGLTAVLPDLRYHAMLLSRRLYLTGSGQQRIPLSNAHGSEARVIWRLRDVSAKAYVDPATTSRVLFRYGQNQGLRDVPVKDLMFQNARWYRRCLSRGGLALDFVAENSLRDTVVPDVVLDMEVVWDLGVISMDAGDYISVLEHAVILNETWSQSVPLPNHPQAA